MKTSSKAVLALWACLWLLVVFTAFAVSIILQLSSWTDGH